MQTRAVLVLALFGAGCSHHVFSPPARALPLESVEPVGLGRTGVQVEGSQAGALFGPDVTAGALRARHGLTPKLDLSLENTWIHIQGASAAHTNPDAHAYRAGARFSPLRWFALGGGLGGGWSVAGPFVSPDVGFTFAWESGWLVPFWGLRGFTSLPISPKSVDTTQAGTRIGTDVGKPMTTWGLGSVLGLRVPIPFGTEARRPGEVSGSLLVGWSFTALADANEHEDFAGLGGGGEIAF